VAEESKPRKNGPDPTPVPPAERARLVKAAAAYKKARAERDNAVEAAIRAGGSTRSVAKLAGVTYSHVAKLATGWRSSRH
jgi:hypothetical protein